MTGEQGKVRWWVIAVGLVAASLVWNHYWGDPDVGNDVDAKFAYRVFSGLARGDQEVDPLIDWEHLHTVGVDIGEHYRMHTTEQQRPSYRRMFILSYANGFKQSGARPNSFTNWRVVGRDGTIVTIAADHRSMGKTLLLMVRAAEPKQLEGLEWQL